MHFSNVPYILYNTNTLYVRSYMRAELGFAMINMRIDLISSYVTLWASFLLKLHNRVVFQ